MSAKKLQRSASCTKPEPRYAAQRLTGEHHHPQDEEASGPKQEGRGLELAARLLAPSLLSQCSACPRHFPTRDVVLVSSFRWFVVTLSIAFVTHLPKLRHQRRKNRSYQRGMRTVSTASHRWLMRPDQTTRALSAVLPPAAALRGPAGRARARGATHPEPVLQAAALQDRRQHRQASPASTCHCCMSALKSWV